MYLNFPKKGSMEPCSKRTHSSSLTFSASSVSTLATSRFAWIASSTPSPLHPSRFPLLKHCKMTRSWHASPLIVYLEISSANLEDISGISLDTLISCVYVPPLARGANLGQFTHTSLDDDSQAHHRTIPKVDFPHFDGACPKLWQKHCEGYFALYVSHPSM